MPAHVNVPTATTFTAAPLRNRLRVQLNRPVQDVWSLVGDPARLPEYSAGLERVDVKTDARACTEYVCHFKPRGDGDPGIVDRNIVRWFQPNLGYASSAEAGNVFGVTNDLNLVTVDPLAGGTMLTLDAYYDAGDLPAMRAEYDDAFADIAERLIARFGGHVIERTVDGPR